MSLDVLAGRPSSTEPKRAAPRRKRSAAATIVAHGEPLIWLTGGSLAICLLMIGGLLAWITAWGLSTFWPSPAIEYRLRDGKVFLGEFSRSERFRPDEATVSVLPAEVALRLRADGGVARRQLVRTGNFDLTGEHYQWISDFQLADGGETKPEWALVVERLAWGRFYGMPHEFRVDGQATAKDAAEVWNEFERFHAASRERWRQAGQLRETGIGALNRQVESARLAVRAAELHAARGEGANQNDAVAAAARHLAEVERRTQAEAATVTSRIEELERENSRYRIVLRTADGRTKEMALEEVVRAYPANRLSLGQKVRIYLSRWWEFLADDPREANTEGGVYPAIFGTVAMTLIMSLAVVPFGILAALYMREYAKSGIVVSAVRVAINNLAGVPSIVFGVFGLGFFCYLVGGFIDGGPSRPMTANAWTWGLVGLAVLASLATAAAAINWFAGAGRAPLQGASRWKREWLPRITATLWLACAVVSVMLVAKTPFFHGFFESALPTPTFGKGALVWASLTLALLTLPVVIVATEEALAAVPNSMREGSYACGASKWQTIRHIVLPRAMPGIMTGMILAMARGAGEVAPLMLVGAVKMTAKLPLDGVWPFLHAERSFMHLGFQVYDVAFQSPNSEAAKPMVYTTTLLLILIIGFLNITAVWARSRLRRKFVSHQF